MPVEYVTARTVRKLPNVLMVGTGEYTTGWVGEKGSESDKKKGVVFLVLCDLRRRGQVGSLFMAGTVGTKFPDIREHVKLQIGDAYRDMDVSFASFPDDGVEHDPQAYLRAMDALDAGDVAIVFTPDDTHFEIGKAAIERGLHVLLAKPPVKTLAHHRELVDLAAQKGVLAGVEVHKRWNPIYADAVDEARKHGDFSYFYCYMSQPKTQLETFGRWAGRSSDISYYLNAHHVDLSAWTNKDRARPAGVVASCATGIAKDSPYNLPAEDVITLMVDWETRLGNKGVGVYTASWVEPESDVHSHQDQRGYKITVDGRQVESRNSLFMKYSPDAQGCFDGQNGYGHVSIAKFIEAVGAVLNGEKQAGDFDGVLPTLSSTAVSTAVLEAGRKSLDEGRKMEIRYGDPSYPSLPTAIVPL